METKNQFIQANQTFSDFVSLVMEDEWNWNVPTTPEWTVLQLVNHVTTNNQKIIAALKQTDPDDVKAISLEDTEPAARWLEIAELVETEVEKIQNMEAIVEGPMGEMPTGKFLEMMITDHVVHAWDLAHAIGADETIDKTLVQIAYDTLKAAVESGAASKIFSKPFEVPDDAPLLNKTVALAGRDPNAE